MGQFDTPAAYVGRFARMDVSVFEDHVLFALRNAAIDPQRTEVIALDFGSAATPCASDLRPGRYSWFLGNDPADWVRDMPAFGTLRWSSVRPGVDLVLVTSPEGLRLRVEGQRADLVNELTFTWRGAPLRGAEFAERVETSLGDLRIQALHAPATALAVVSSRSTSRLLRMGTNEMVFDVAEVGASGSAIAEATLSWSGFLGGPGLDGLGQVEVMANGDICVAGQSTDLHPTTPGSYQPHWAGSLDIVVARMTPGFSELVSATYVGGAGSDSIPHMCVGHDGDLVLTCLTESVDFPVTAGAFDTTHNGAQDPAVFRLSDDLTSLQWGTFLGGSAAGLDLAVAVDCSSDRSVVVGGYTYSADYPTTMGALQPVFGGGADPDAFITKLSADGSSLVFSTFFGGSDFDAFSTLSLAANDDVFFTAFAMSPEITGTPGAFQQYPNLRDGVIGRLTADGSSLSWLSFFDGDGSHLAEQPNGDLLVVGLTDVGGMPITRGVWASAFTTPYEPHAMRIAGDGSTVLWASYLGEVGTTTARASTSDDQGRPIFVGGAWSSGVPTTPDAFQPEHSSGCADAYVSVLDPTGSDLQYSSYLGPTGFAACNEVADAATDGCGGVVLVGFTSTGQFPVVGNPFDPTYNGSRDGWIARFQIVDPWESLGGGLAGSTGAPVLDAGGGFCPGAAFAVELSRARAGAPAYLVLGFSTLGAPFKGGTLWPTPDVIFPALPVSAAGTLELSSVMPPELAPGLELVMQFWVQDPAAVFGFAASNGVRAFAP